MKRNVKRMRIRLYESLIELLLIIGVGIPLIFGFVLDTWRTVLTIAIVLVWLLYIVTHKPRKSASSRFLNFYLCGFTGIVIYEIIKATTIYNYSDYEIFYALRQYSWLLLSIPLYYEMIKKNGLDRYLNIIVNITVTSLIIRAFTWFCKNYLGFTVFYNLLYEYGNSWGRDGKQRLDATALIGVIIPILYYMFRKYRKRKYLGMLVFVFLYLVFVSQTRTLLLGAMACMIAMVLFERRSSTKKLIIQLSFLAVIIIAINMGAVDFLIDKMNLSVNDGSIGYRQYEFAYFSSLIFPDKWKTGLGIITTLNPAGRRLVYGNLDTQMYLDDLGVFECFLQFGLFSLFLYGTLMSYIVYVIVKCNREKAYNYTLYLTGQLFYIALVSLPLNLFGIQRVFSVPIVLAITCTIHNHLIEMEMGKIL